MAGLGVQKKPFAGKKLAEKIALVDLANAWKKINEQFVPKKKEGAVWDEYLSKWIRPADLDVMKKEGTFHSVHNFIYALQRKGFKKLGNGAFSTVLAKEGQKRVLKVTRREDNWINYAFWASKNGWAGTFAPLVYSYKKIKTTQGGTFEVTVVERLPETLNGKKYGDDARVVSSLLSNTISSGSELSQLLIDEVYPGMGQFAQNIRDSFPNASWDLHGANIMVRENGMPVLTDPMVTEDSNPHTRLRAGDFSPASTLSTKLTLH